ncbi:hypothetical protein FJTKL_11459 [Diaporthe vaccinii]|uniref:DUF300 domain-containing protein n=1 Tax=Diaporthe vaccinii TaxID=105482 RepID=A0ABR4EGG8_9PEZI
MNLTYCNTTVEDMEISEIPMAGPFTFHELALMVSAATALLSMFISFYLIWMHALNYTKPEEQKYIIRILLMIPIYAASAFLQLRYYHEAVYFAVISDCYEAFAISSFFALLCQYTAADLHSQKQFFRELHPVKKWVWPLNWFKKCCGGDRGPWRTPVSGLTWFNIIWIGIYHYCFIRVAMTITAVVSNKYDRYCESSNSPYFAHIWCASINCVAVTIAMYCVIQFYVQLKTELSSHKPFLKVLAIKGVIFLSFWQTMAISVGTGEFDIISPTATLAYPDIAVGIPSLLLCVEMLLFSIMHIWAYPWRPYQQDAPPIFYPLPNKESNAPPLENVHIPPAGGSVGLRALWDALNLWDVIKAFGRGMRWLFVGAKRRKQDASYRKNADINMDGRSTFGMNQHPGGQGVVSPIQEEEHEEGAGLIAHAQGDPSGYRGAARFQQAPESYQSQTNPFHDRRQPQPVQTHALSTDGYYQVPNATNQPISPDEPQGTQRGPDNTQQVVGAALWGANPHQHPNGPMI